MDTARRRSSITHSPGISPRSAPTLAQLSPTVSDGQYPHPDASPTITSMSVQEGVTLATVATSEREEGSDAGHSRHNNEALIGSAKQLEMRRKYMSNVALFAAVNSVAVALTEVIYLILNSTFHSIERSWTAVSVPLAVSLAIFALRCSAPLEKITSYVALCFVGYNALVFVSFWALFGFCFEAVCVGVRSKLAADATDFFKYAAIVSAVVHGMHMLACLVIVLLAKRFAASIQTFVDLGGVFGAAPEMRRRDHEHGNHLRRRHRHPMPVTGVVLGGQPSGFRVVPMGRSANAANQQEEEPEEEYDVGHEIEQPVILEGWFQQQQQQLGLETAENEASAEQVTVEMVTADVHTSPASTNLSVAEDGATNADA